MAGRFQQQQPEKLSYFQEIRKTPAWTVGVNATLFVAGVAFITSPLMEMLVPQL